MDIKIVSLNIGIYEGDNRGIIVVLGLVMELFICLGQRYGLK